MASSQRESPVISEIVNLSFEGGNHVVKIHKALLDGILFGDGLTIDPNISQDATGQLTVFLHTGSASGDLLAEWPYHGQVPHDPVVIAKLEGPEATAISNDIIDAHKLAWFLDLESWANRLADVFTAFNPQKVSLVTHVTEPVNCDHLMRSLIFIMIAVRVQKEGVLDKAIRVKSSPGPRTLQLLSWSSFGILAGEAYKTLLRTTSASSMGMTLSLAAHNKFNIR